MYYNPKKYSIIESLSLNNTLVIINDPLTNWVKEHEDELCRPKSSGFKIILDNVNVDCRIHYS